MHVQLVRRSTAAVQNSKKRGSMLRVFFDGLPGSPERDNSRAYEGISNSKVHPSAAEGVKDGACHKLPVLMSSPLS